MTAPEEIWHGGDLADAKRLFPDAPEPWIDLSTGINPIPYPLPALPLSVWQRLPGRAEEEELLAAARRAWQVPDAAGLVAAPGTQILIETLPRCAPPGTVAVLGPTYAEHAARWRRAGRQVREIVRPEELGDASLLVLVNPNNPDGRVLPQEALSRLAVMLAARGGLLVVDEAFADFTSAVSIVPQLPPATVVLRSFGKSYGLAGLRLGFAVAPPEVAGRLQEALGRWAVPGPALAIGTLALADAGWLAAAAADRAADAARLDAILARHGRVVGGTALFRLLESVEAPALFRHLGAAGLYVRRFQHDPRRLRFGLPPDETAWRRLQEALGSFRP